MDGDATTTLQNALDVLRQHYGEQVPGPQLSAEAQMRQTLEQQMGLSPLEADRVLKQLCISGRVVYVDSADAGAEAGTRTGTGATSHGDDARGTGPVISMPLTQSADGGQPLITSASPAMLMGITGEQAGEVTRGEAIRGEAENTEGDTLGWLVAPAIGATPAPEPTTTGDDEEVEGNRAQGYWRIG
jgi:hypothetical protein